MPHFLQYSFADQTETYLTIVECIDAQYYCAWLDRHTPYIVEVTQGEWFRGLFDLDGTGILASPEYSPPPDWRDLPLDVVEAIAEGWQREAYSLEMIQHTLEGL